MNFHNLIWCSPVLLIFIYIVIIRYMLSTTQGLVMSQCENIQQCSPCSRPCPACQWMSLVGSGVFGSQLPSCSGWWHMCRKMGWGHIKYQQDKWNNMVWKAQEIRWWEKWWTEAVSVECAVVRTRSPLHISLYMFHRSKGPNGFAKNTVHWQKTGPYTLPCSGELGKKTHYFHCSHASNDSGKKHTGCDL